MMLGKGRWAGTARSQGCCTGLEMSHPQPPNLNQHLRTPGVPLIAVKNLIREVKCMLSVGWGK